MCRPTRSHMTILHMNQWDTDERGRLYKPKGDKKFTKNKMD